MLFGKKIRKGLRHRDMLKSNSNKTNSSDLLDALTKTVFIVFHNFNDFLSIRSNR